MKNILILFILVFILQSCGDKIEKTELLTSQNEYVVPEEDQFFDIIFNKDGYTLQELHDYYLTVKETKKDEKYYNNLRKIIIYQNYKDRNKVMELFNNQELLSYYVEELISMPYISDMSTFAAMLAALDGHWSDTKIGKTAKHTVERNIKYIQKNFKNPQEIFSKKHQARGIVKLNELQNLIQD